ncbi:MAG TPA: neutral zinc metallopeptidase [Actinomycetota bacterium]|nr:neutral zinc metallopeptidase [Actinomycetota bacterium]
MRFRSGARLDTSQVSDRRGMGGPGGLAVGGGGIIGVIFLLVQLLGGGGGELGLPAGGGIGSLNEDLSAECQTGEDANQRSDCRIVGVVNSLQEFWGQALDGYRPAKTVFFEGSVQTGCGGATSAVGPFYCPLDQQIYIDLGFYDELRTQFGAQGGPFAEAYVIAHEYGHHVENLLGYLERGRDGQTGPQSGAVRVELMADCLAGLWAGNAVETGFIEEITDADIADGLNAAASIGDDRIQQQVQGQVSPEKFTHGSAAQRQRWFRQGFEAGSFSGCDTFRVRTV